MKKLFWVFTALGTILIFYQSYSDQKPQFKRLSEQEAFQIAEQFLGKKIQKLKVSETYNPESESNSIRVKNDSHSFGIENATKEVSSYYFLDPEKKREKMTREEVKASWTVSPEHADKIAFEFIKQHYRRFNKAKLKLKDRFVFFCCAQYDWQEYKKIDQYTAVVVGSNIRVKVDLMAGIVTEYTVSYPLGYPSHPSVLDDPNSLPVKIKIKQEQILEVLKKYETKIGFKPVTFRECCPMELIIFEEPEKLRVMWHGDVCTELCTRSKEVMLDAMTGEIF